MKLLRRHSAITALIAAGLLWGLTVPLSKLALEWLPGGWLTVVRFALAAPLLAIVARRDLRRAITPQILFAGAVGYGIVIMLQNAGIHATSVSHAALIVGAVPALVALIAAATGKGSTGPLAWVGFALALAGVGIVAGGGGGGATLGGDALVFASVTLSASFVVLQPKLLRGQNPMAVTAVQMIAGALIAIPNAALEGIPAAPATLTPVVALLALILAGTLLPFALFAYGQSRVSPELAGAFLNLEPLVGTAAGALAFGDPFGPMQLLGGAVIVAGIALSTTPRKRSKAPAADKRHAARTHRTHQVRSSAPRDARQHPRGERPKSGNYVSSSTPPHSH
ncbi:DMT family transporter [Solirubrobacter taibaiensis]|nr:DMT family transporter [Solirubrobacter taibaiensis]